MHLVLLLSFRNTTAWSLILILHIPLFAPTLTLTGFLLGNQFAGMGCEGIMVKVLTILVCRATLPLGDPTMSLSSHSFLDSRNHNHSSNNNGGVKKSGKSEWVPGYVMIQKNG